jgi:transcription initiation factor TFIID subunit 6
LILKRAFLLLLQPIYGFATGDPLRFKRAARHKDLFYVNDKDLEFKDVIEAPLSRSPLDTAIAFHWLAIEGVQPAIPENVALDALATSSDNTKHEYKEDADIKYPVKHVLSRELQVNLIYSYSLPSFCCYNVLFMNGSALL